MDSNEAQSVITAFSQDSDNIRTRTYFTLKAMAKSFRIRVITLMKCAAF